jgi:hypothetical protein
VDAFYLRDFRRRKKGDLGKAAKRLDLSSETVSHYLDELDAVEDAENDPSPPGA